MLTMLEARNPVVWVIGIIAFAVARARRRLDKSHRPVISRKQGPTVQLAVHVDKP
jgi:uncharacterized membrane protein YecN with MAPEG domain